MCGIAGFFHTGNGPERLVTDMLSSIRHRGPDEAGVYLDRCVALGHCRLSIVGLVDGTQPIGNEDGTIWVVYNGEIFNYPELKGVLERQGHRFATHTDTEILVHLYEEHGREFLPLLNGQFAFALWDTRKRELFLARDRVGIRPLYYYHQGGKYSFASEVKALFADPSIPRSISPHALRQVFTYWSTLPPFTPFGEIYELPPAHFQVVKGGRIVAQAPYWQLPYYPPEERFAGSIDDAVEETRALLADAIKIRLRADVPVAAYLSGGLDSSIIASTIAGGCKNELRTFSIGFSEAAFDETPYQRTMARQLGTRHSEIRVTNEQIRDSLSEVVWHAEKPLLRTAPVPMFLLAKLVRDSGFKVVVTGEGADEIFGGYDIFKEAKIRSFWSKAPGSAWRPRLLERLHPYIFREPARYRMMLQKFFAVTPTDPDDPFFSHRIRWNDTQRSTMFFSAPLARQLTQWCPEEDLAHLLPAGFASRDLLARSQLLEIELFLSSYLLSSQGDRVAMANSVELRLPFLDYRIIDLGMKLPPRWKIRGLHEKYILKKAFGSSLPKEIVQRPKLPYRAPIRELFLSGQDDCSEEFLSEKGLAAAGYFDVAKTRNLLAKYREPDRQVASEVHHMAIVGILTTQILHQQFIEKFRLPQQRLLLGKRVVQEGT
ncbi:asparagine synthase (glutamine-hydrolyzing) [Geomonas agri]|uniref:asparagine synthase (glutamine-hydrolyzing) n=1 Tax=Geomonas agri TaxID=2873702 RepID=UPI001CD3CC0F|nr:asparagine synthase (glutamine-hydrolyzing) [Geomonas agri]